MAIDVRSFLLASGNRAIIGSILLLLFSWCAFAGDNVWTKGGSPDIGVNCLVTDPLNLNILYGGTRGRGWGVIKTLDGGATWTILDDGLPYWSGINALAINPTSPSILYAGTAGNSDGVFKTNDGGAHWNPVNTGLGCEEISCIAIDPSNPLIVYVGAAYPNHCGGVFKTTNGGESWVSASNGLESVLVGHLAVDPITPSRIYAGTSQGVFKSLNGGTSWSSTGLTSLDIDVIAVDPLSPGTIFAGTAGGGIYISPNFGETWATANSGLSDQSIRSIAIDPVNPTTIYAGSGYSGVFKSTDVGASWTPLNAGLSSLHIEGLVINPGNHRLLHAATWSGVYSIMQSVSCEYSIDPSSKAFPSSGGSSTINVTAASGCTWTAISNSTWIQVTAGSSGNGNGTTSYFVAGNSSSSARTGTITIAGKTFTVAQDGAPACSLTCAAVVPESGVTNQPIDFQATATPSHCSGSPTFSWSFGDGSTSPQQNPTHSYASVGTFHWTLATSVSGVTCLKDGSIVVAAEPFALNTANYSMANVSKDTSHFSLWMDVTSPSGAGVPNFEDYEVVVVGQDPQEIMYAYATEKELVSSGPTRWKVTFALPPGTQRFEEGRVRFKRLSDGSYYSIPLSQLSLSVVTTGFAMDRHAYPFYNGQWGGKDAPGLPEAYIKAGRAVGEFVGPGRRQDLWNAIGIDSPNVALCYGMAVSAAASFNHRRDEHGQWWHEQDPAGNPCETDYCGWSSPSDNSWYRAIETRWSADPPRPPQSPYEDPDYLYTSTSDMGWGGWSLESAKKIAVYHIGQPFFQAFLGADWVGKDSDVDGSNLGHIEAMLAQRNVLPLKIKIWWEDRNGVFKTGWHRVNIVQILRWNHSAAAVTYDPNWSVAQTDSNRQGYGYFQEIAFDYIPPSNLVDYFPRFLGPAHIQSGETRKDVGYGIVDGGQVYGYTDSLDHQRIYSFHLERAEDSAGRETGTPIGGMATDGEDLQAIKITLIGARTVEVYDDASSQRVALVRNGSIDGTMASLEQEPGGYSAFLCLPPTAGKTYRIEVTKDPAVVALMIFASVPKGDGSIQRVGWQQAQMSELDATKAVFKTGVSNTDHMLRRTSDSGQDTLATDFAVTETLPVPAVESVLARRTQGNSVVLTWENPTHPELRKVRVVRKENSAPVSDTDGSVLMDGMGQSLTDNPGSGAFFYAVYSFGPVSEPTGRAQAFLDTSLACLAGTVADSTTGMGLPGAVLAIMSTQGVVQQASTDSMGRYAFCGLNPGSYEITCKALGYTIANPTRTVTVSVAATTSDFSGSASNSLELTSPDGGEVWGAGEARVISWLSTGNVSTVRIEYSTNGGAGWSAVTASAPNSGTYLWTVPSVSASNCRVRVSAIGGAPTSSSASSFTIAQCQVFCVASVTPTSGDAPFTALFRASAYGAGCAGSPTFAWDFDGDGVVDSRDPEPVHIYSVPSTYTWSLTTMLGGKICTRGGIVEVNALSSEGAWVRTFSEAGIRETHPTSDGGMIVIGYSGGKSWIARLSPSGSVQWQRLFDPSATYIRSGIATEDGQFMLIGQGQTTFLENNLEVCKLDSAGGTCWQRQYDAGDDESGEAICSTSDGKYLLLGGTFYPCHRSGWFIKIDEAGEIIWQKKITPPAAVSSCGWDFWAYAGAVDAEGNLFIIGSIGARTNESKLWIGKVGPEGETLWWKEYGYNANNEYGIDIRVTDEGSLFLSGNAWLAALDREGNILWQKAGPGNMKSISPLKDGTALVSYGPSSNSQYGLLLINGDGTLLNQMTVPVQNPAITLLEGGRVALVGRTRNPTTGDFTDSLVYSLRPADLFRASCLSGESHLVLSEGQYLVKVPQYTVSETTAEQFDTVHPLTPAQVANQVTCTWDPCATMTILQIDTASCPVIEALLRVSDADGQPIGGLSSSSFSASEDGIGRAATVSPSGLEYVLSFTTDRADGFLHGLDVALYAPDCGARHATGTFLCPDAGPTLPGDCDEDGAVSIGEVQKAINMFLGSLTVGCGVDCSGDGAVSIGEVQKVINLFLGLATGC